MAVTPSTGNRVYSAIERNALQRREIAAAFVVETYPQFPIDWGNGVIRVESPGAGAVVRPDHQKVVELMLMQRKMAFCEDVRTKNGIYNALRRLNLPCSFYLVNNLGPLRRGWLIGPFRIRRPKPVKLAGGPRAPRAVRAAQVKVLLNDGGCVTVGTAEEARKLKSAYRGKAPPERRHALVVNQEDDGSWVLRNVGAQPVLQGRPIPARQLGGIVDRPGDETP